MVGMGRIGQAVAHRLRAFGVDRVLYWGRGEKAELKGQAEFASMDQLLKESDYVVACCALTPETKELFDYDAFKKMKETAVSFFIWRKKKEKQVGLTLNHRFL